MSLDLSQVLYGLFLAGAVYGGIRAELRAIHARLQNHEDAVQYAHRRINDLLIQGK